MATSCAPFIASNASERVQVPRPWAENTGPGDTAAPVTDPLRSDA